MKNGGMKKKIILKTIALASIALLLTTGGALAEEAEQTAPQFSINFGGSSEGDGAGTVMPDLSVGAILYSIPIEVPVGRNGMDPGLSLLYRSNNGDGWVGYGWELEVSFIKRRTTHGLNYDSDDYVLRMAGSSVDLVLIGTDAFGAKLFASKIEGRFDRIRKINAAEGGTYWELIDKKGIRFYYGRTSLSRQDSPQNQPTASGYKEFKWCLDKVVDPNGNDIAFILRGRWWKYI